MKWKMGARNLYGRTDKWAPSKQSIHRNSRVLSKGFELLNAITRGADVEEPPVFSLSAGWEKERKEEEADSFEKKSDLPSGPGKVLL